MLRTIRLAGLHLALVAMLLRALLPAGWMPDTSGPAPFVICTMNGPVLSQPAKDGSRHQPQRDDGRQTDVCPFAASVHLATPTATAMLAPSSLVARITPSAFVSFVVPGIARYTPQSPRAPPSFA